MKLRLIGIFAVIMLLMLMTSNQFKVIAENIDNEEEHPQLYRVIENIVLDDFLVLNPDALIFAERVEDNKTIKFKYNGKDYKIPIKKIASVPSDKYEFEYKDYSTVDLEEGLLSTAHYLTNSKIETGNIEVSKDHTANFYTEDDEKYVLVGNIPYKVSKKEVDPPLESSNSNDKQNLQLEEGNQDIEIAADNTEVNKPSKNKRKDKESEDNHLDKNSITQNSEKKEKEEKVINSNLNTWDNNARYFKVDSVSLPVYDNRSGRLVKVGELKQGQTYPIQGNGGNWHIIQFNNIKGFVWKNSTVPGSGDSIQNEKKEEVKSNIPFITKQNVVIYDNSNGNLIPFGSLSKNVEYKAVANIGNWVKIIFANRIGYVYKDWLQMGFQSSHKFFRVTDTTLPIYQRINGSLVKKGELKKNQAFSRLGVIGNWHKIQFGNSVGYVWSKSTLPAKKTDVNNLNTDQRNTEQFFTTKQHVVVYDLHNGKMTPIGAINENLKYPIVSDIGNWIKIIFGDRVAYVYKEWVKLDFKSSDKAFKTLKNHIPVYYKINGTLNKAGHLIKNQVYLREGYKGNWHKIDFGNHRGYVWMDDTEPSNRNLIKNLNKKYSNTPINVVANNGVVIYDNSEGMKPFARLESDVVYPIASSKKLGNWYRVLVGGRVGYVYHSGVSASKKESTKYNISLSEAVSMQMKASPKTDLYTQYVHSDYVSVKNGRYYVNVNLLNVRSGPGTNYQIVDTLNRGEQLSIRGKQKGWYRLYWVDAKRKDVEYYLDPNNFVNDKKLRYQFLDLSKSSNTSVDKLNEYLEDKGILRGLGNAFIEASKKYKINDVYLVSHATLETGNGSSKLANGVKYNGITVYNMFGIGAYDNCAVECGARRAYEEGWTTPYKAVVGGARFIGNGYIDNGLNTLYKMRWNPKSMETSGKFGKQYATDIGWATKQITTMYNLYQELDNFILYLDIPQYK